MQNTTTTTTKTMTMENAIEIDVNKRSEIRISSKNGVGEQIVVTTPQSTANNMLLGNRPQ